MNTINKQLDKELFGEYHPRLHPLLPLLLSNEVIKKIDKLYIGWDYGDSVLELK